MTSGVKAALEGRYSWNMTAVVNVARRWTRASRCFPGNEESEGEQGRASDEINGDVIRTFSLPSLLKISTTAAGLSLLCELNGTRQLRVRLGFGMPRKRASPSCGSLNASKFKGTSVSPFMNRLFTFYLPFCYLSQSVPTSIHTTHPPLSFTDCSLTSLIYRAFDMTCDGDGNLHFITPLSK